MNTRSTSVLVTVMALSMVSCDKQPSGSNAPLVPPGQTAPAAPANTPAPAGKTPAATGTAPATSSAPAATTPAAAASTAGAGLTVMGVNFAVPAGWKSVPPASQMRLAEIQVPDASGDASKACVIAFSTAGGDVASNIARWAGQVKSAAATPPKAEVRTQEVAGMKVSTVEFEGAYSGMGDASPKADWMLRGSIVEMPQGLLFVKMTGPAAQMKAAGTAYKAMIDGMKK